MPIEVIIGNNQNVIDIPEAWLTAFEDVAPDIVRLALSHATHDDTPLHHLATLEAALVDDETSDRVHREFMAMEGATDVITFHHGEIVIGAEVAFRQAAEYAEPPAREILRYLVHGILHLAGHEDHKSEDRTRMEQAQESIVLEIWTQDFASRLTHRSL